MTRNFIRSLNNKINSKKPKCKFCGSKAKFIGWQELDYGNPKERMYICLKDCDKHCGTTFIN